MQHYKLRVDTNSVTLDQAVNLVKKHSGRYAFAQENVDGENPHVHFFLSTLSKEATIRSNLRSLGLKGNGSYSLKELDEEFPIEYLAYLGKEGRGEYVGFLKEEINVAQAHDAKVKLSIKEKKENKKTVLEKLDLYVGKEMKEQDVMVKLVEYHIEHRLPIRRFQLQAYFDTLMCRRSEFYRNRMICHMIESSQRHS